MRSAIGKVATLGFILAIAVLIINGVISFRNTRRLAENDQLVIHTQEVLTTLAETLSILKDAETGQRGYLVTGEARYLEPYNTAHVHFQEQFTRLKELTRANAEQQPRLALMEEKSRTKFDELARNIRLRQEQGFDAARREVLGDRGKQTMDDIRRLVGEMEASEKNLFQQREKES